SPRESLSPARRPSRLLRRLHPALHRVGALSGSADARDPVCAGRCRARLERLTLLARVPPVPGAGNRLTEETSTTMRASVFIATSLDGFIARTDGALDWLPGEDGTDPPEEHGYEAFIASVDVVVIGRGTYEKVLTFDGWPYRRDMAVRVLTTTHL